MEVITLDFAALGAIILAVTFFAAVAGFFLGYERAGYNAEKRGYERGWQEGFNEGVFDYRRRITDDKYDTPVLLNTKGQKR